MRRFHLNANQLKIIAIIAMTIDHLAAFVPIVPLKMAMRLIGRLTAPIMCFMIAEGYYHTSNRKRYLGRLILFAVISHFAYCLFNNFSFSPLKVTSVIWSLAMGLLALIIVKEEKLHWILRLGGLGMCCLLAYTANWNYIAVLWVVAFGWFRGNRKLQMLLFALVGLVFHVGQQFLPLLLGNVAPSAFSAWYQPGVFLAIPLLLCYDGTLGRKSQLIKQLFYWYYPAHMLLLYLLRLLLK